MKLAWIAAVVLLLAASSFAQDDAQHRGDLLKQARQSESRYRDKEARALVNEALKLDPANAQAKAEEAKLESYEQFPALTTLANQGETAAMNRLGDRLAAGQGVKANSQQALEWYRKSAEKGDADGLYRVGLMLDKSDPQGATACFQAAAEAGQVEAMLELGRACLRGHGIAKNPQEGVHWLQKASEKGDEWAMLDLSVACDVGWGIAKDRVKASRLRQQAEQSFAERVRQIPASPTGYHDLALFQSRNKQMDQAIQTLRKGVDASGGDADLRYDLVDLLTQSGNFDEAQVQAEQELRANPRNQRMRDLLAFSKLSRQDYPAAMAEVETSLKNDPQDSLALTYRGWLKFQRGDNAGAIQDYQAVLKLDPGSAAAEESLGEALERSKQLDLAAQAYQKAIELNASSHSALRRLVFLELNRKNWPVVDRLLEGAESDPDTAWDPHWPRLHARAWLMRENADKAIELTEKSLGLNPPDWDDVAGIMEIVMDMPGGGPAKVLALSDKVMRDLLASRWWSIRLLRGIAFAREHQTDKALIEFDAAMGAVDLAGNDLAAEKVGLHLAAVDPRQAIERLSARLNPRWLVPLAGAYILKKDYAKAAATADELAGKISGLSKEGQARAWEVSAQVWQKISETDPSAFAKAEKAYTQCLGLLEGSGVTSQQIEVLNNLAWLIATRPNNPDPKLALQYSTRAIKMMKDADMQYMALLDTHGWCLVLVGKVDEGIGYLQQALKEDSSAVESRYHLAEAYLKKHMPKEALEQIKEAKAKLIDLEKTPEAVDPEVIKKLPDAERRAREMLKPPPKQEDNL